MMPNAKALYSLALANSLCCLDKITKEVNFDNLADAALNF